MKKILFAVALGMLTTAILTTSCVKDDFSDPAPYSDTTSLKANTTIADLKAKYPGKLFLIDNTLFEGIDSVMIEGVVVSDDKAGNFYKSIFIQDATGGIEIKLSKNTLYNEYKRGQRLLVICKGLFMGDYGGQIQLGSTFTENGVTQIGALETDFIIGKYIYKKGKILNPVSPKMIDPTVPNPKDIGSLVKISRITMMTVFSPETGAHLTYADAKTKTTINHALVCKGTPLMSSASVPKPTFVLRTSGYAKFAGDTIPSVEVSLTGVMTYYNGTYQLLLRDTNDVVR